MPLPLLARSQNSAKMPRCEGWLFRVRVVLKHIQIASNSTDSALFETLKDTVLGYSWCQWRSFRICTQKSRFFLVSEFGTRLAPEAYRTYPVRGDLY